MSATIHHMMVAILWALIFLLLPLQRYIIINSEIGATWNLIHIVFSAAVLALYLYYWRAGRLQQAALVRLGIANCIVVYAWLAGLGSLESLQATFMILTCLWATLPLSFFIKDQRRLALYLLIASLTLQSLWAVAQFSLQSDLNLAAIGETPITVGDAGVATFTSLSGAKLVRAYGPYPHPNILAGSLVLGLIALAAYWKGKAAESSRALAILTYFIVLALLLTFSRAGWLAAGLVYGVTCLTATKLVRATLVFITILIFLPLLVPRLPATGEAALTERQSGSIHARTILQELPPWRGIGPGNYEHALRSYFEQNGIAHEPWHVAPVHNVPLLLVVEFGLLPIILLAWLVFPLLPRWHGSAALLLPIIPLLWFDHYLVTQPAPLMYLAMVLLLAASPPDRPADQPPLRSPQKNATADPVSISHRH